MDIEKFIQPKSDQLNADDLISGEKIIKIKSVEVRNTAEQPISVHYEGISPDVDKRPWKLCKTTARILSQAWSVDSSQWVGKYVELYRDPTVKWAGIEIGGIRVSGLSDIPNDLITAVTLAKGKRMPKTIKKLVIKNQETAPNTDPRRAEMGKLYKEVKARIDAAQPEEILQIMFEEEENLLALKEYNAEAYNQLRAIADTKLATLDDGTETQDVDF